MAVDRRAEAERSGVADLRLRAFHDVIELGDFRTFSESMAGRVKYTVMKQALEPGYTTTEKLNRSGRGASWTGVRQDNHGYYPGSGSSV